jgi:hypothetical protein
MSYLTLMGVILWLMILEQCSVRTAIIKYKKASRCPNKYLSPEIID